MYVYSIFVDATYLMPYFCDVLISVQNLLSLTEMMQFKLYCTREHLATEHEDEDKDDLDVATTMTTRSTSAHSDASSTVASLFASLTHSSRSTSGEIGRIASIHSLMDIEREIPGKYIRLPLSDVSMPKSHIVYNTFRRKRELQKKQEQKEKRGGSVSASAGRSRKLTSISVAISNRMRARSVINEEGFAKLDAIVQVILLLIHKYVLNGAEFELSCVIG